VCWATQTEKTAADKRGEGRTWKWLQGSRGEEKKKKKQDCCLTKANKAPEKIGRLESEKLGSEGETQKGSTLS